MDGYELQDDMKTCEGQKMVYSETCLILPAFFDHYKLVAALTLY